MFRNRNNSQKPNTELIQKFQRMFSDVIPGAAQSQRRNGSIGEAARPLPENDMKTIDTQELPRVNPFSPLVDPNALSMLSFAHQPNGILTPNLGGFNPAFHSQHAGDLHTPTMGLDMINSLSQLGPMDQDATGMGLNQYGQSLFSNTNPFQNQQPFAQQPAFAPPSVLVHRDSGYDAAMDESIENSSLNDFDMQADPSVKSTQMSEQPNMLADQKFRYNVSLRAPTAMIKSPGDIPITYLNKGQAYALSIVDSKPPAMSTKLVQYRTFVRVSFQEEEQRAKPAACWQLWKEGRGLSEAHQRGGKLQAVEYVDPFQGGDEDRKGRQVQIENTSFDGFCVTWTANPATGTSDCTIPVRFNFLSTDFSHSKGVKGIPVRLCAKTQLVSDDGAGSEHEVSYCQVKLFRDHGAERKLSNDVAHVKKTIEKLRQQITQAEMGAGNNGKRKRTNASVAINGGDFRPPKITKHRRTWSMDSRDGTERVSLEDDLHAKLAAMQEMFTSTRPVSNLNLQGEEQDDPDLFPVQLPGGTPLSGKKSELTLRGTRSSIDGVLSPAASNLSHSPRNAWNPIPGQFQYDSGYQGSMGSSRGSSIPTSEISLSRPVKVQRISADPNVSTGYIEAVDIDPTYRPPAEHPPKPIACFYLRFPRNETQKDDFYRAVYLSERTVSDLMEKISHKQLLDPSRVVRVLHVKENGLKIMVDDDVVRELPDGQDMDVEISETSDALEGSEQPPVELKLSY
ncbi:grainyhead-like protein [Aspergillus chevalieri]|uniref:Grh/CP2 DB domain-containing protein n=1 Tax=Aspergillus chevalieri TaxID=182096 RepID=A0A7R7VJ25_ASPCH|nr:uncharacterized protein ACHE_21091S [Aspergillus chevalieri]BCR85633.1 hypothetical protein ACHE_21091S [Aspergillus chevalieri]